MDISKEIVRKIILKVNIADLIGEYIPLNKNGKIIKHFAPFITN